MKNRIIWVLIWILLGIIIFLFHLYSLKEMQIKEVKRIEKEITRLDEIKKKNYIEEEKEKILKKVLIEEEKKINNIRKKDKIKSNIKIVVYDYNDLYKQIYKKIVNDEKIKKKIWYKDFQNTFLYNRLEELKKQIVHTKLTFLDTWKELNFEYLIIDIDCNGYCKKSINREINNVYKLDNSILKRIKFTKELDKKELIKFLKSEQSFYNYFNNK